MNASMQLACRAGPQASCLLVRAASCPRVVVQSRACLGRCRYGGFGALPTALRPRGRISRPPPRAPVHVCALSVGLVAVGAAVAGVLAGLVIARAVQVHLKKEFDPKKAYLENARLRAKVEDLQQMVLKFEPMAHKDMRLRFTKGVNKAVILGLVDELLSRKDVNIWWLPDSIERIFYLNCIQLLLSVMDEVVEGMNVTFAGHNVKLQLTYLDMDDGKGKADVSGTGTTGSKDKRLAPA